MLLRLDELAKELGLSPKTIRRLRQRGLPCVALPTRPGGRPLRRYVLGDVTRWLAEQREAVIGTR